MSWFWIIILGIIGLWVFGYIWEFCKEWFDNIFNRYGKDGNPEEPFQGFRNWFKNRKSVKAFVRNYRKGKKGTK